MNIKIIHACFLCFHLNNFFNEVINFADNFIFGHPLLEIIDNSILYK